MRGAAIAAGAAIPEPIELPELDEYPAFELFKKWLPKLVADDPALAEATTATGSERRHLMERAIELVSYKWARGELDAGELESFPAFDQRVNGGISSIMKRLGRKKQAAVVTSGGPISVTMRRALGLAEDMTLRVAWVIANASITVFACRAKTERAPEIRRALASRLDPRAVRFVEQVDLPALIQLASVIVFPVEDLRGKVDLPISLLEAMQLRVPVVAWNYGPLSDLEGAELIPPFDVRLLVDRVAHIVRDPAHRQAVIGAQRHEGGVTVRAAPFDAVELELGDLWA
jgi:hypothetical protein